MRVKTQDLTGPALDWAVAKADSQDRYITFDFDLTHPLIISGIRSWGPSFIWSQGGPIIEREFISISPGEWDVDATPMVQNICAWSLKAEIHGTEKFYYGPTPLVAAMLCFVASKLGDEVDVPEELSN